MIKKHEYFKKGLDDHKRYDTKLIPILFTWPLGLRSRLRASSISGRQGRDHLLFE